MQLHTLKRKTKNKRKKTIGRGGKRGTYCGRGLKGQRARAGRKIRPEIRDVIKKIPKKRGYKFASYKEKPEVVNVGELNKFSVGEEVNPKTLAEKGLVKKNKSVKILGNGEIKTALSFKDCLVSAGALKKIEAAGGGILKESKSGKEIALRPKRLPKPDKSKDNKK